MFVVPNQSHCKIYFEAQPQLLSKGMAGTISDSRLPQPTSYEKDTQTH